jgi:hypothetical protein
MSDISQQFFRKCQKIGNSWIRKRVADVPTLLVAGDEVTIEQTP